MHIFEIYILFLNGEISRVKYFRDLLAVIIRTQFRFLVGTQYIQILAELKTSKVLELASVLRYNLFSISWKRINTHISLVLGIYIQNFWASLQHRERYHCV